MGFKIKKRMFNGIPVMELHGRVSGGDTLKVSRKLERLSKKSFDKVIIDLSRIDFIDSSWLGVFVYSWKLYNENNKQLIFLIPPGNILNIFKYANLDTTFSIIDSLRNHVVFMTYIFLRSPLMLYLKNSDLVWRAEKKHPGNK